MRNHPSRTVKIAALNDRFRQWTRYHLSNLHMSPGFLALNFDDQTNAMIAISAYDFRDRIDILGERRFGWVEVANHRVYWKILYRRYDWSHRQEEALDPTDGRRTRRVLCVWVDNESILYEPGHV